MVSSVESWCSPSSGIGQCVDIQAMRIVVALTGHAESDGLHKGGAAGITGAELVDQNHADVLR